ncbi:MAG: hypothetical protein AB3N06_03300 [Erythrobacter sp.]
MESGDGKQRVDPTQRLNSLSAAASEIPASGKGRQPKGGDRSVAVIAGCPPGFTSRKNGCLAPDQSARPTTGTVFWNGYEYGPDLLGVANYGPGRFLYESGYLLRREGETGIAGYIPLLGGALAIGNPWPVRYESPELPDYYVDYFDLGSRDAYRFADNVIYRVDPDNTAITSIAALLTGDEFEVGRPMPSGYEVYNVPYSFRNQYADAADAWYRYSDGYVYRIDPQTQVVTAAIALLM